MGGYSSALIVEALKRVVLCFFELFACFDFGLMVFMVFWSILLAVDVFCCVDSVQLVGWVCGFVFFFGLFGVVLCFLITYRLFFISVRMRLFMSITFYF